MHLFPLRHTKDQTIINQRQLFKQVVLELQISQTSEVYTLIYFLQSKLPKHKIFTLKTWFIT